MSHSLLYGLCFDDAYSTFVGSCFRLRRLHLLGAVAQAGIPKAMEAEFVVLLRADSEATTDAGVWLDALSSCAGLGELRSFPQAVNDWAGNPAACHGADLILRLVPDHPHIAELDGTPLVALLIEARLRECLEERGAARDTGGPAARLGQRALRPRSV